MNRRSLAPSVQCRRRVLLTAAAAALAGALAAGAPAPAAADVRVSENIPLRPGTDVIYGRDAIGLAANPRDPQHIVAVWADWVSLECEAGVSTNGGKTWRRTRLQAPAGFADPACTIGNHLAQQIDGGVAFGRGNNVYVTFATSVVRPDGTGNGKSILVAKSTNGGRTFGTATIALAGGEDPDVGPDYSMPKLAVQPGAQDRIYIGADTSGTTTGDDAAFTTSADSGRTWSAAAIVDTAADSAIEQSGPAIGKGAVYMAYRTRDPDPQARGRFLPEGTLVVAKSTDRGRTWTRKTVAGVRGFVYEGPSVAPFVTSRSFNASTFPRLAADPKTSDVYLAYGNGGPPKIPGTVSAADHFIHPDMDVYFQRSGDGGGNWSLPTRVNGNAPLLFEITQTRHPTMSVAPNGRVDVVWQDRRHWYRACTHTHAPCAEARLGDTYLRSSNNKGTSFGPERRITDRSMNNDVGFDYRFGAYWDYGPRTIPLGNDKLLVGWMDSRDGNVETDNLGLWTATVDLEASRTVPVQRVARTDSTDLSVKLSRLTYPAGAEALLAGVFATAPASRVVIVNERDFASALAGGVLARANLGPVLLSPAGGLPAAVKAELSRLAPVGAYVVGGTGALSEQVVTDLAASGIAPEQIVRIAGADAADTAAQIATAMDRRTAAEKAAGTRAFDAAVIVNPASPDAAAASALAANRRLPILNVGAGAIPPATASALTALGITDTIVVGNTTAVGAGVLAGLPKPQRISGSDAVATSRLVYNESRRRGLPTNIVYTARATQKLDTALLGSAVGRLTGQMLLTRRGASEIPAMLNGLRVRGSVDRVVSVENAR